LDHKRAAKYHPEINIETLDGFVRTKGTEVTNGKLWRVMKFHEEIGAIGGKLSHFVRAEDSVGAIHGNPITETEFKRLAR